MSFERRKVLQALRGMGFEILREGGRIRSFGVPATVCKSLCLGIASWLRGTVQGMAEDAGVEWEQFRKDIS